MTDLFGTALLWLVLENGESDIGYVPRPYCEEISIEVERGSKVDMVALDGEIVRVSRAACYALPAIIGDCEIEEDTQ